MKITKYFILFFVMFVILIVPASGAPTITLLSQSPSVIYQNSTGFINISYGITHDVAGLNNTSVSFIFRTYDHVFGDSNHSFRVPDNNLAAEWNLNGQILRGANRNETLNFENNDTITGGDIYSWSGLDENNTDYVNIVPVNSTYTLVYINGTIHNLMSQTWYLDRSDQIESPKTQFPIHSTQGLLFKFWVPEITKGSQDFISYGYADSALKSNPALWPTDANPIEFYYLNASYNPAIDGNPLNSEYIVYLGSLNSTEWNINDYTPHINSSYTRRPINVSLLTTAIETTDTSYLYFTSNTLANRPFYMNVINAASSTNISFADTGVMWSVDDNAVTHESYTPNFWFANVKNHNAMTFDHKLFVADNNDVWNNSLISETYIGGGLFPPAKPFFNAFHFDSTSDYDMNGTYTDITSICVGVGTDPDGGDVTHTTTIHYADRTYIATIDNTLTNKDIIHNGLYAHVDFDVTPYYSDEKTYTLRIIATDDEGESITTWLGVNFTLFTEDIIIGGGGGGLISGEPKIIISEHPKTYDLTNITIKSNIKEDLFYFYALVIGICCTIVSSKKEGWEGITIISIAVIVISLIKVGWVF